MADYTQDEITSAVTSLVQSTVSTPIDTLGTRRTDVTFSQVQQAVAGVFILYPLAPYYCVFLGVQQTLQAVASEAAVVASILEAINSLGRYVLPVTDLTPLYNAQAALQALQSAVAQQAPADITKLAQYQRYATNTNNFLSGPAGQAVKQNGAIVPTPAEAQASLPGLMTQLQQAHVALVTAVTQYANAIDDYNSVNLPTLLASGIITNAASVLASDIASLAALTPAQRLAALRQPVLNTLTAQATITTLGSSGNTSSFYTIPGPGAPYWDATHLATPATLVGTLGPPYNVQTGVNDQLTLTMDGGAPFNVTIPGAVGAQVLGTVVESAPYVANEVGGTVDGYLVQSATNPVGLLTSPYPLTPNNALHFQLVTPSTTFDVVVSLTVCSSAPTITRRTAQDICNDINGQLRIAGVVAAPFFYPTPHFSTGTMNITPTVGSTANFTLYVPGASSLAAVVVGDIIVVPSGPNADIWDVTAVSPTTITANARVVTPSLQTNVTLQIGPKDRAVGMTVTDPTLIAGQMSIVIVADNPTETNGALMIGWPVGATFNSLLRVPSDVYASINQQTQKAVASSTILSPVTLPLVSDPTNPFHVTAQRIQAAGALTYTPGNFHPSPPIPNSITISYPTGGLLAAGVIVGDTLILMGQGNTVWSVSVVSDTSVTATSDTYTATSQASATFEIGPTFTITQWETVSIASGPNAGEYIVSGQGTTPLDILFMNRWTLPHYVDPTTMQPITMTGVIGTEVLTISSVNTTTSSSVQVSGPGADFFWTTPLPAPATGTTPYLLIPTPGDSQVPQPGDTLTFYATNYGTASETCTVETVDPATSGSGYILGLSPEIGDVPVSWPFPPNQVPYATLEHGHMVDYATFQTLLNTWLAAGPNQPSYFQMLSTLINPLTANANPTAAQVNAALAGIKALADLLDTADNTADMSDQTCLQDILQEYAVADVSQIDTLVATYNQKGSDLAIDTLLSGQFSSFFGLTEAGSSYAGAMQSAMQAVAQNDLPVRKVNRPDALQSRMVASTLSPDNEFNTADAETGLKPDAPIDFAKS